MRLTVHLAVDDDGTGTGTMSDPVYSHVNSHLIIVETRQRGNRYDFHGQISLSNAPELLYQSFIIFALTHGEETLVWLQLGEEIFAGPGRIINIRANATLPPPRPPPIA